MYLGGQKPIFGQQIQSSVFRPKVTQKWFLEISYRFPVGKKKYIYQPKMSLEAKIQFLSEKSEVQFLTKSYIKIIPGGLRSIF